MAAAPSSLGEQFHEELTCSICLELFTRPKVLPCQHTFCQDCLQDHAGRGGAFQCPNCRQQVRMPRKGVAGLPDSHIVASLCERLQNQARMLEEPQSGVQNRCSFHPSEEVKLYCNQCNVPVCNECLDEIHTDHGTMSLKKALEERRAPVQDLITEGRNILDRYCSFLKSLREKEKTLDEQKQQTDNRIYQTYNQMVQKLTENRNHLLASVDTKHRKSKEQKLQAERDRVLADVSELSAACDRAENKLEKGGVEFLSQETVLTEVVGKYRGKAAPTPVHTEIAVFQPADAPVLGHVMFKPLLTSASSNVQKAQTITLGVEGSESGELSRPLGVAVSAGGEIFVADCHNQRIQVFTLQGTFVRQFSTVVPSFCLFSFPVQFLQTCMYPHDVALDGEGNLWVVGNIETAESAVQYNKQGRVLRKFDLQKTPCDRLVAVDTRRNHILITQTTGDGDKLHGEVLVYRPDGTLVRTVGKKQGMKRPWSIAVDREGNILVSDADDCIFMYDESGQFLFRFEGEGRGELVRPNGKLCADRAGNITVVRCWSHTVHLFDKTGRFLRSIATDLDMTEPHSVAMGTQGQLVVTDPQANTVHIIRSWETAV
ncbi:uncharacterized protein LOC144861533 [Branchiostoma floridae x Branchiostoma japonicum]